MTVRERPANPLPDGVTIDGGTATGTIMDNDEGEITLGPAELTAAEDGEFTYTVSLSRAADEAVIVRWTAAAGPGDTATVDDDLRETTGTVTFAARNNTAQEFTIAVNDDDLDEENETFTVTLEVDDDNPLPTGVTIGTTNSSTATITDNDEAPVVNATLTVPIADDTIVEDDETFTVTLTTATAGIGIAAGTATGTITDSDTARVSMQAGTVRASESRPFNYSVRLSAPVSRPVTLTWTATGGTATVEEDLQDPRTGTYCMHTFFIVFRLRDFLVFDSV